MFRHFLHLLSLAGLFFFTLIVVCPAQQTVSIRLRNLQAHLTAAGFYIGEVVEDPESGGNYGAVDGRKIVFENGLAASLNALLGASLDQDPHSPGVTLHIRKLSYSVHNSGDVYTIAARFTVCFYYGDMKLLENTGTGKAEVRTDASRYIEEFLRKSVTNSIMQFNKWWVANKGRLPLTDEVKVVVTQEKDLAAHPNLVRYSRQRPLVIGDFRGHETPRGIERASTSSGTAMGFETDIENGQTIVRVYVSACFDRDSSWFLKGVENDWVLAHEQTHFDITALKACELIRAIGNTHLNRENYQERLQELRDKYTLESNEMQSAYDSETNHGINREQQIMWRTRLKQAIDSCGCY